MYRIGDGFESTPELEKHIKHLLILVRVAFRDVTKMDLQIQETEIGDF